MIPEQLLKLSSRAGKLLLENGAEIQRTEDTICRLCEAYGVEEASAFVIPTGMFLSFSYNGNTYSKIMRIRSSSLNLERINLVNELSRRCERQAPRSRKPWRSWNGSQRYRGTADGRCGSPAV